MRERLEKKSLKQKRQWLSVLSLILVMGFAGCSDETTGGGVSADVITLDGNRPDLNGCIGSNCENNNNETDTNLGPVIKDADHDGIADHLEDRNYNGVWDPAEGESDWQNADSDNDGILDGVEDANRDGQRDENETDPNNDDTDGDGLLDGIEDANRDGIHDPQFNETDPRKSDTDDDGLSDLIEFQSNYGGGRKTDPNDPDTDNDLILDGIEDANQNGLLGPGETNPTRLDTDQDGISDGCEDLNRNGILDEGESNPFNIDSDGDGLRDGGRGGECVSTVPGQCPDFDNHTQCPTDPTKADTDGDGLSDAVELYSDYNGLSTNPRMADTDGDGLLDGEEDFNRNGWYDLALGELNPTIPATLDGTPDAERPQAQACTPMTPPPVLESEEADLRFAHAPEMDVTPLAFNSNDEAAHAWTIDHPNFGLSGFIITKTPDPGTDALRQARLDGARLSGAEVFFEQTFETWDGKQGRITTYRFETTDTLPLKKARNSYIAELLGLSPGEITGLPDDNTHSARRQQLVVTTIYRSSEQVVLLGATLPNDVPPADILNILAGHITNGGALASFDDALALDDKGEVLNACDVFRINNLPIVDFLFVVDDTNSMRPYQALLSAATDEIFETINNAFISARWAITSTEAGPSENTFGHLTQCGLTNNPRGVNGSIWSNFLTEDRTDFRCRVRDPIGVQNCDTSNNEQPGFAEYGLVCSKWAIDYIQGRRGNAPFANQQRPRSALILIVLTDEGSNLPTYPADLDNGDTIDEADRTELLDWMGQSAWTDVSANVVADSFIPFFKEEASQGPYGDMTPFFIYSKNELDFRGGYHEVMDATPGTFPKGASFDIRRCAGNPQCTDITEFVKNIVRVANALASPFDPTHTPITIGMRMVLQRGFTGASEELFQSGENGWMFDPVNNTLLFFGPSSPQLLDGFAVSYVYWAPKN